MTKLTDERIVEIRDDHLPSQGGSFDCIAFARSIEAEVSQDAVAFPPIKGVSIDGGYVIVTPAGSSDDKAPAVKAAILAAAGRAAPPAPSAPAASGDEAWPVPDGVWEALQRMIEDGQTKGPASQEDALLVARYRRQLVGRPAAPPPGEVDESANLHTNPVDASADLHKEPDAEIAKAQAQLAELPAWVRKGLVLEGTDRRVMMPAAPSGCDVKPYSSRACERGTKGCEVVHGPATPPAEAREADMPAICAALGFDPTNHHNALKCPYCNPDRLALAAPPVAQEATACRFCGGTGVVEQYTSAAAPHAKTKCPMCAGDGVCRTPEGCDTHGCHGGCLPAAQDAGPVASQVRAEALEAEIARLNAIINTPQSDDFLRAVSTEAEHQRQRWPSDHDAGKTPADWFWLVGYLAGKALHAHGMGVRESLARAVSHLRYWRYRRQIGSPISLTESIRAAWSRFLFERRKDRP